MGVDGLANASTVDWYIKDEGAVLVITLTVTVCIAPVVRLQVQGAVSKEGCRFLSKDTLAALIRDSIVLKLAHAVGLYLLTGTMETEEAKK